MTEFLDGRVVLHPGDCMTILPTLAENSIDACVCDPPYHLTSIVKRFGSEGAAAAKGNPVYARASAGFMGKKWDGGDIAFRPETWAEVLRVLKPGGYLIAFGGTRTYHRLACAIEDAGFEIRDMIPWHYGSGFPKSHNISKAIDKHLGARREKKVLQTNLRNTKATGGGRDGTKGATRPWIEAALERGYHELDGDIPATQAAAAWDGWGTALKPATEPICLARKPLSESTVAANVLRWGVGALNIDATRVGGPVETWPKSRSYSPGQKQPGGVGKTEATGDVPPGRWPANLIHDGSDEVLAAFPVTDSTPPGNIKPSPSTANAYGEYRERSLIGHTDSGSAARFFYTAKADATDRIGSVHPTVKPLDLMQYLVRLVCPLGGVVLDPFAGTGTTGEAAWREGMRAVLIEAEPEYQADIARRMDLASNPTKRNAVAKSKNKLTGGEGTPLFG